jgi:hypothetical protein
LVLVSFSRRKNFRLHLAIMGLVKCNIRLCVCLIRERHSPVSAAARRTQVKEKRRPCPPPRLKSTYAFNTITCVITNTSQSPSDHLKALGSFLNAVEMKILTFQLISGLNLIITTVFLLLNAMTNFLISNTIRAAAVLTNKMEKGVVLVYMFMFFQMKNFFFLFGF